MYKYNNIFDENGPCKFNLEQDVKEFCMIIELKNSAKVFLNVVLCRKKLLQENSRTIIVDEQLYLIKRQVGYLSKLQTAGLSFIKRGSPSLHKE